MEIQRLIHELRVHQIELELQNQALLEMGAQFEQSLERYTGLDDFAPTGYFILTVNRTIREANCAGAILLDQERAHLIGRRFGLFVSTETRPNFKVFLDAALAGSSKVCCEVTLTLEGVPPRHLGSVLDVDMRLYNILIIRILSFKYPRLEHYPGAIRRTRTRIFWKRSIWTTWRRSLS